MLSRDAELQLQKQHTQQQLETYMQFRPSDIRLKQQPELHEQHKTTCMKMFAKLATQTDLSSLELQAYYKIRF